MATEKGCMDQTRKNSWPTRNTEQRETMTHEDPIQEPGNMTAKIVYAEIKDT